MEESVCKQSNWQGINLKLYKQLMQLYENNIIKKMGERYRHFSEEDI